MLSEIYNKINGLKHTYQKEFKVYFMFNMLCCINRKQAT